MKCKNCGRDGIPAGAAYCCWCGKRLVVSGRKKKEIKVPEPILLPSGNWNIILRKEEASITEPTPELCRAKAIAVRAGFLEKEKSGALTLEAAIDKYIQAKDGVLSPSTIRGYRNIQHTRFQKYMQRDVNKMTPARWQNMINDEAKLVSPKTLKNAWLFVASALSFAGVPHVSVTLPQLVAHDTPFLEPDEITRFVDYIKGSDIEIACLLGLSSLRISEAQALHWEDIDLDRRMIHVHRALVRDETGAWIEKESNKNATSTRYVPIMMDALYDALSCAPRDSSHVVTLTQIQIRKRLDKACAAACVTPVSFHGLRHSFASLAAHLGMPEAIAMQIGGWANEKIMKRIYTHVLQVDVNRYQNDMADYYNE